MAEGAAVQHGHGGSVGRSECRYLGTGKWAILAVWPCLDGA